MAPEVLDLIRRATLSAPIAIDLNAMLHAKRLDRLKIVAAAVTPVLRQDSELMELANKIGFMSQLKAEAYRRSGIPADSIENAPLLSLPEGRELSIGG